MTAAHERRADYYLEPRYPVDEPPTYRARCACGWTGPERYRGITDHDWSDHMTEMSAAEAARCRQGGEAVKSSITHEADDGEGNLIGQITVPVFHEIDPTLLWLLRRASECWGALGVAIAAASMTDSATLIAHLTSDGARDPKPNPLGDYWEREGE